MIDPYKREVRKCEIENDLYTWYTLLKCDCVDCQRLMCQEGNPCSIDLWFDDEFLLKEPIGPGFKIASGTDREAVYHGYAFMAAHDGKGNTISLAPEGMKQSNEDIKKALRISFEIWEKRLDPNSLLDQQLRTIELELPGRFKFLDLPVDKNHQVR